MPLKTEAPGAGAIKLSLQRQQAKALTCPANEILYGGAAGGGKSHLMRVAAIRYATAVPGIQIYLFRRSYSELNLNHMEGPTSFRELLAPLVNSRQVAIVEKEIRFWNGSKIHLCHLQYSKTLQKYQGAEIHVLLMDELTHFHEAEYRYLRGRVRIGSLKVPPAMRTEVPVIICGTNPGSVGHGWVKRTFVNQGPMRVIRTEKTEGGMRRVFIPARLEDNPAMLENDPEYVNRLEALGDPLLVKALKEGDWDIVAGAMFGDTWRKDRHECDPFPIPTTWKIWMGLDDGYAAPASCHWLTEDPDRGTIYVIAELYKSGMLAPDFASRVLEISDAIPRATGDGSTEYHGVCLKGERFQGLMDAAAFAETGQAEIPRGNQMKRAGVLLRPAEKWPGSRVHRCQNLHRLLAPNTRDPDRLPGIRFFRNCKAAIETIPTLPRDDKNIEDVDTDAEDHAYDSITYGLQWKERKLERRRLGGL